MKNIDERQKLLNYMDSRKPAGEAVTSKISCEECGAKVEGLFYRTKSKPGLITNLRLYSKPCPKCSELVYVYMLPLK